MTWALTHRAGTTGARFSLGSSRHLAWRTVLGAGVIALALCGCDKSKKDAPKPTVAPDKKAEAAPKKQAEAKPQPQRYQPKGSVLPKGPKLIVVPGVGLGAIRRGTNLETLSRHMEGPCDIQTETRCLYIDQAVDFRLQDGIVVGFKVERRDRRVPGIAEEKYFGAFNGLMPPSIMLGLHRHIVIEEFGEPLSKEPLTGADGQVEQHKYKGVTLEYDTIDNGSVVLAAMDVDLAAAGAGAGNKATAPAKPAAK